MTIFKLLAVVSGSALFASCDVFRSVDLSDLANAADMVADAARAFDTSAKALEGAATEVSGAATTVSGAATEVSGAAESFGEAAEESGNALTSTEAGLGAGGIVATTLGLVRLWRGGPLRSSGNTLAPAPTT